MNGQLHLWLSQENGILTVANCWSVTTFYPLALKAYRVCQCFSTLSNLKCFKKETEYFLPAFSDQVELQKDLNAMVDWSKKWACALINAQKCNLMNISWSAQLTMDSISSQVLDEMNRAKYVNISYDLDWSDHVSITAQKGNLTLGFLCRNLKGCPEKLKELTYIWHWSDPSLNTVPDMGPT